ncbi:hypothetical protein FSP39_002686 [Pinctada imbricata]|uniref:Galactosyltransferase N-terminal domain-containing protein n=1 Tax=Pinctada imbricata TaxID=66713 RepID=A0AA88Y1R0_PINIB|nr:hypothetical protein FSP39_002686 [Pinctada imbricata]
MKVDVKSNATLKDIEKELREKPEAGRWFPKWCFARDRVAIVIPFRDRHAHLTILLKYLIPMLQRQLLDFRIFVPEQLGNGTFNKGRLMNAAVKEAMSEYDFRYMYDKLVGGALNLRKDHLLCVNGYSNGYWGWGAEDDDMAERLVHV